MNSYQTEVVYLVTWSANQGSQSSCWQGFKAHRSTRHLQMPKRGLKTGLRREWRRIRLMNKFVQTYWIIALLWKFLTRDGRSQAGFWLPRPHWILSQVKWLEYLCTSATLVGEVNALRKLVGSSHRAQNITVLKTYLAKNDKNSCKSEIKYLQPWKRRQSSNIFYYVFYKTANFVNCDVCQSKSSTKHLAIHPRW